MPRFFVLFPSFVLLFVFSGCGPEPAPTAPAESRTSSETSASERSETVAAVENGDASEPIEGDRFLLRYRFRKGEVLRWNVLQSLKITTSVRGQTETLETSSRSVKVWTVLDVGRDGSATFEYSVENVDMTHAQTGREPEHYDSRKDPEVPPRFINLEGTIGVPLAHLTIDARGETKKKSALRPYSAENRENRIVIPLPEKPIAVGEHWDIDMPIEIKQPEGTVKKVSARQRFTLDGVRTGIAKIKFVSQILTPLDPKEESQILDKYSRGSLTLDLDVGHVISQELIVDKRVVGFQGLSDHVHHQSRFTECCCGLNSCELCRQHGD